MLSKYELGYTCRNDEYEATYTVILIHPPDAEEHVFYDVKYKCDNGEKGESLASEYFLSQCIPIT